ncbi:histidine kinase [Reichenbachiella sp.]|uniref:tetratricopeptide repeat-containing sensor histidine kinase n=1 Tax=Reichenbachiella sp. TaxID=2184521 RepID=UPI003BAE3C61
MQKSLMFWGLLFVNLQVYAQSEKLDSLGYALFLADGEKKTEVLLALMDEHACSNDSMARYYYSAISSSKNKSSKIIVSSLSSYGKMLYCLGQLDSSTFYYKKALGEAQRLNLPDECPFLYNKIGYMFQSAGQLDSSIFYFNKGIELARATNDSLHLGAMIAGIGIGLQHMGKTDSAMILYLNALEIAEKIEANSLIITSRLNISTYYYDHQPNKLKISDFEEMLDISREIGDQRRELSILEWLGYLHSDSSNFESALVYFNEGLELCKVVKDTYYELLLLQGMSYMFNLSGDFEKAITTNNQIIERSISTNHDLYLPSMYANNALNFLSLGKNKEAVSSALQAIELGQRSSQIDLYYRVYNDLARAYSNLGQFEKAYEAQKEFTKLSNEILDSEKSKQLVELETKYETEKKEAEIATLSQQSTIQALELKQKNTIILVGLMLVGLIAAVVYFMIKQKSLQGAQTQMELEQRFLRSQLNPHFISNALLAVQNFMLKNETDKAASYLSKFAKLMRETLENSRQEFVVLEDEIKMLTNFMDIHKMRLNDSFNYEIHLSDAINPEIDTIPPMFVQPFVENAIEHGIAPANDKGRINLYFDKDGDFITIVVTDNGGGYAQSSTLSVDHHSLSTTIIEERIAVFNQSLKKKIQLVLTDITAENGEIVGAKVALKVPFRYV